MSLFYISSIDVAIESINEYLDKKQYYSAVFVFATQYYQALCNKNDASLSKLKPLLLRIEKLGREMYKLKNVDCYISRAKKYIHDTFAFMPLKDEDAKSVAEREAGVINRVALSAYSAVFTQEEGVYVDEQLNVKCENCKNCFGCVKCRNLVDCFLCYKLINSDNYYNNEEIIDIIDADYTCLEMEQFVDDLVMRCAKMKAIELNDSDEDLVQEDTEDEDEADEGDETQVFDKEDSEGDDSAVVSPSVEEVPTSSAC